MTFGKKEKGGRQYPLTLGKDTDAQVCKRLGGTKVEGLCVVVETGIGEDGDIHLKVLKNRDVAEIG